MTSMVIPITDFRKEAKNAISALKDTAIVLTQRSRPVAVLVGYDQYLLEQKRVQDLEVALDDYLLSSAIDSATDFVSLDDLFVSEEE